MIRLWSILSLALFVSTSVLAEQVIKPSPKINYTDNLLMNSKTAKRLEVQDTDEVRLALKKARDLLEQAKIAHQNGIPKQANALAGLALRKFTEAAKLLPASESAQKVMKVRYAELTEEIASYLEWYETAPYVSGDEKTTIKEVNAGIAEAEGLYNQKHYKKANKILSTNLDRVVNMSNRSMTSSEIVSSLDFATADEEYKYELGKNAEYKRLIPIAMNQKKPTGGKLMLIKRFIKNAEDIRVIAESEYESQSIEAAIKSLQKSTKKYLSSLRMMGIR